ncbi:MAG: hypothetical protein WBG80_06145, partial [Bacteroidota bacterium]
MAILFRRANGIYYHVSYHKGRRTWRSTGKRRRVDAEKTVRSWASRPEPVEPKKPKRGPTLSEFTREWQEYAETNLARTTVLLYRGAIKTFLRHLG